MVIIEEASVRRKFLEMNSRHTQEMYLDLFDRIIVGAAPKGKDIPRDMRIDYKADYKNMSCYFSISVIYLLRWLFFNHYSCNKGAIK